MGLAYATLELRNAKNDELASLTVEAIADTGAMFLCIPAHVAMQLGLEEHEKREITLADGTKQFAPYVGPVEVRLANRRCFVGAMVLGNEVLLGAIPMEDMDVVVHPLTRRVIVNPDSPNFAHGIVKRIARYTAVV